MGHAFLLELHETFGIDPHHQIGDGLGDLAEAMRDVRRYDDEVPGRDLAALAAFDGADRAWAGEREDGLSIGIERRRVHHGARRHECARARDHSIDFGLLVVLDLPAS